MNVTKILSGIIQAAVTAAKASQDRKITIGELLDIAKAAIDGMGLSGITVVDFEEEAEKKSESGR